MRTSTETVEIRGRCPIRTRSTARGVNDSFSLIGRYRLIARDENWAFANSSNSPASFSSCHGNVYACFVNAFYFCARRSSIIYLRFLIYTCYVDVSHRSSVPTKCRRALYLENIYIRHAGEHYVTRIILLARVAPRLQHFRPGSPSRHSNLVARAARNV